MLAKYLLSLQSIFISEKTLITNPIALTTFYIFFLTVGVDSPFGSKSVSLYLLVTRAVLFSKAFSTGISEALIWYFPYLPYRASYISSVCSKPVTADVWLRAQLLFLPQTCSLCWHLRMQVALLECWLETYLLVLSYLSSVCTDGKTSLSISDS